MKDYTESKSILDNAMLSEDAKKKLLDTEFGLLLNEEAKKLKNLCVHVEDQYALNLIQNKDGENILLANVHFPSGIKVDEVQNRLSEIINHMGEIKESYSKLYGITINRIYFSGDINVPVLAGFKKTNEENPNQNIANYNNDISKVKKNIEAIYDTLSKYQNIDFKATLSRQSYIKTRLGNCFKNPQGFVKNETTSVGTGLFVRGIFLDSPKLDNVKISRGDKDYLKNKDSNEFYFDRNPRKFNVLDPVDSLDHGILEWEEEDFIMYEVNGLETRGKKGAAPNPYGENTPSEDFQEKYTASIHKIARDAAYEANHDNTNIADKFLILKNTIERDIYVNYFVDKVFALDGTEWIRENINKEVAEKLTKEKIHASLIQKINKKLKPNKNQFCEVHRTVTDYFEYVGCPDFGGFDQDSNYREILQREGAAKVTERIEQCHVGIVEALLEKEKPVFLFLCENVKFDPLFSVEAKVPMTGAFVDEKTHAEALTLFSDRVLEQRATLQFSSQAGGSQLVSFPALQRKEEDDQDCPLDQLPKLERFKS